MSNQKKRIDNEAELDVQTTEIEEELCNLIDDDNVQVSESSSKNDDEEINEKELANKNKKIPSEKDKTKELKAKIKQLEEQIKYEKQLHNADIANLTKKRIENEMQLRKYGSKSLAIDLIKPIELLQKVISTPNDNPDVKNYLMGFEMISNQITQTLENNGIVKIVVNLGDEFNSNIHEATEMVQEESFKSNQITSVISDGYKIHDQILVHALVKVQK